MPSRVLIIDDDEDVRDSLVEILKSEGFDAQGARSGLVALTTMTWQRFTPDVILLDLLMPAMNGDQFRTVLAKHPQWRTIPIVLCTGTNVPEEMRSTVFSVLDKPFDLDKLLEQVRKACGISPG